VVAVGLTVVEPLRVTVPMPLSMVTAVAFVAVQDRVTLVPAVTEAGCADKVTVGLAVEGSEEVEEPVLLLPPLLLLLDGTPPHPANAIRIERTTRIDDLQRPRGRTTCNSAMLALESGTLGRVARQLWRTYVSQFVTSEMKN
jgi:hypothetical protein